MTPPDLTGKRALFEATALPFAAALYNTALRLTGEAPDASDLVQETFLRAYRTFENFAPATNCKAWLLTILYSIYINQRRRAQHAEIALPPDELELAFERDSQEEGRLPEPDEGWGPEVERAVRALPEPLRAAVLMVDVAQLPYEEAAVALGWPIGTLRSRLFRARKRLYTALEGYARTTGHLGKPGRLE